MYLPSNLVILPGVQTDHRGRAYQQARYPSGKVVLVPYSESGAPPARTIPLPPEPERQERKQLREMGSGKPIHFLPKRLMCLTFRERITQQIHKVEMPNAEGEQYFNDQLRPLSRFDGKQWHPVESPQSDYYFIYHLDSKEPQCALS